MVVNFTSLEKGKNIYDTCLLLWSSPSLVNVVKPFVVVVATTKNQEQCASSYILISSNASPFLKRVR